MTTAFAEPQKSHLHATMLLEQKDYPPGTSHVQISVNVPAQNVPFVDPDIDIRPPECNTSVQGYKKGVLSYGNHKYYHAEGSFDSNFFQEDLFAPDNKQILDQILDHQVRCSFFLIINRQTEVYTEVKSTILEDFRGQQRYITMQVLQSTRSEKHILARSLIYAGIALTPCAVLRFQLTDLTNTTDINPLGPALFHRAIAKVNKNS